MARRSPPTERRPLAHEIVEGLYLRDEITIDELESELDRIYLGAPATDRPDVIARSLPIFERPRAPRDPTMVSSG